jgi:hypothetical protein
MELVGAAGAREHNLGLVLTVLDTAPTAPQLQVPANGAKDLPAGNVQLTWSAIANVAGYQVQVATSESFGDAVIIDTMTEAATYLTAGLEPGREYFWRVRALNACGEGDFSVARRFSTQPLPGECPVSVMPSIIFEEDFEGDLSVWQSGGIGDTWGPSTARAHEGARSIFAQDSAGVSDQRLVSPPIRLPTLSQPLSLRYWDNQEIENNLDQPGFCYDGAVLEVTTNNGQTWQQLVPETMLTNPYDGEIAESFGNPLAGRQAWCGNPQDWTHSVVSLNEFGGRTLRLRFRLATDMSVGTEGWFVDDLVVSGCPATTVESLFLPLALKP